MNADGESSGRRETLAAYRIFDTAPEAGFDNLTRLACSVFQTPISTLTLLDDHRQWFKSRVGIGLSETPIEHSFCFHAAAQPADVLVVGDATMDSRFSSNPFVLGEPFIRFYAGAPLVLRDGSAVGAICVIDQKPRFVNSWEQEVLQCLAAYAVDRIEARKLALYIENAADHIRHLQSLLPVCPRCGSARCGESYASALKEYLSVLGSQIEAVPCAACPRPE